MKRLLSLLTLSGQLVAAGVGFAAGRVTESFDAGWKFLQSNVAGAELPDFKDTDWRAADLPHDWSIAGPFSETNKTGGAGAWLPAGVGWYRKTFSLPSEQKGRRVFIEFDGVMANSDVWINGKFLGHRPNGYVSFTYELTEHLNLGKKPNVLAVRADNSAQPASRWYAGAGIYRHVRLIVTDPVHLEAHASFITTPVIKSNSAVIHVETRVTNSSEVPKKVTVMATISGPPGSAPDGSYGCAGECAPILLPPGQSAEVKFDVKISWTPRLWSLERPDLHRAWIRVRAGERMLDGETVTFGIREFRFDATNGFSLNGRNFKLKGVCLHADGSAFGAAVPLSVWERRLSALRELGCNAIRTAHGPALPDFLDLCDRMGFLVMDELFDCWTVGKTPYDYHLYFKEWSKIDARDTLRRDRNHPCLILWSVGNEIHDTPKAELAKGILSGLVAVVHENDPTRPVTQALFRPNVSHDYDNGLADMLDVIGTNYRDNELLAAQRAKPERKIVGTEQGHELRTWLACRDNPSHSGQFLWSGVDYLGESRRWPIIAAGSGLLDRTGAPKPMGRQRQSWWSDKPMVFITRRNAAREQTTTDGTFAQLDRRQILFSDWTPANLDSHEENVEVYSNCEEVELFLNDKSLGAKPINADASPRNWSVPFEPGVLKAVARNKSSVVATHELRTADKAAKILLTTDRAKLSPSWDDVAFVSATVVDENAVRVPTASDLISFKLGGPGVIAAVDSADNSSHEPFQASERRAFQGRCQALVKATGESGKLTLTASAPGLTGARVELEASPPP